MGSGEWGLGIGEWGVGSGEWGVGSGEWGVGSGSVERMILDLYINALLFRLWYTSLR